MTQIQVDVLGLERLRRKLRDVPEAIRPLMTEAGGFAHGKAREYAKPHPVDKGTLAEQMKFRLASGAIPLEARIYPARSIAGIARTVEEGRRPGKPPPAATIARWAKRHGYPVISAGFQLQREIRRRGTKGVKMFERAAKETEAKLPELMRNVARQIETRWGR